jgi:hypothetical protein
VDTKKTLVPQTLVVRRKRKLREFEALLRGLEHVLLARALAPLVRRRGSAAYEADAVASLNQTLSQRRPAHRFPAGAELSAIEMADPAGVSTCRAAVG